MEILSDKYSYSIWHLAPAVEVRQRLLWSGVRGWGVAVPTELWSSRLRSGSAHWDLDLAVLLFLLSCSSSPFWSPTRFLFFSPSRFAFSTLFSLVSVLRSSCPKSAALMASAGWHEGLGELKCSMLLLLLSSFFVPLLPLFPFFSSTSCPSPQHSWQMLAVMRGSGN